MADRLVLTAANQQTAWYDLRQAADKTVFHLTGNFNQAVSLQVSNNDDADKGTDYLTLPTTYSAPDGPLELPFGIARFVRFVSGGAWGAGTTCKTSFANTRGANGSLFAPTPQSNVTPAVTA